ncbi:MAG: hypothetical protein D4R64_01480 [Porphyromonadaceae bacterium]|nr:MAG: hypothetical protein D4R64_01480 [Porphyromonadaceae bacterium]
MKFETPTNLINPDTCKKNIRTMADKASRSGVIFRPHFKTHQSISFFFGWRNCRLLYGNLTIFNR